MNEQEYFQEVRSTAVAIIEESIDQTKDYDVTNDDEVTVELVQERINDSLLHETIDGHELIIYTANHLPILQFSHNDEYMVDNIGGLEETLKSGGLSGLHQALAFWAFYADVQEEISDEAIAEFLESDDDNN